MPLPDHSFERLNGITLGHEESPTKMICLRCGELIDRTDKTQPITCNVENRMVGQWLLPYLHRQHQYKGFYYQTKWDERGFFTYEKLPIPEND